MAKGRPTKIAEILSEVMARRGYTRVHASARLETAWQEAAGELVARYTRVGNVRRGSLEIIVAHSALVQELTYQKADILARLAQSLPEERIADLRWRVGPIE